MNFAELKDLTKPENIGSLTAEQRASTYIELFELFDGFSKACGFGDPFSYARSREILMACTLGHSMPESYSGADGINQAGDPVEYKSTIGKKINGTYNGISVLPTWKEQERYLREDKIGKYSEHYFARFDKGRIVELWKASGQDVLDVLMPKLRRTFGEPRGKDPRLGASVTNADIKRIGTQLI